MGDGHIQKKSIPEIMCVYEKHDQDRIAIYAQVYEWEARRSVKKNLLVELRSAIDNYFI